MDLPVVSKYRDTAGVLTTIHAINVFIPQSYSTITRIVHW